MRTLLIVSVVLAATSAQNTQRTTPVPILKQINTQNDDGSYTYGYEGADGSFKIETKFPTGEVQGKYGYVDSDGKVREVEYGASRRGFEPSGTDINVPPPVANPGNALDYDDGSYKDDPDYYNEYKKPQANRRTNAPSRTVFRSQPKQAAPAPVAEPARYDPPAPVTTRFSSPAASTQQWSAPAATPQWNGPAARQQWSAPAANQWNAAAQQWNAPAPRQQWNSNQWNNAPQQSAANVNLQTGSYSLSYVG